MHSILILMDNFAPQNNCGAIPNTKLVKYLAREDCRITLITKAIVPAMLVDQNLVPEEMASIRTFHVSHSPVFTKTLEAGRNKITDNGIKLKMKAETRPVRAFIVSGLKNTYFRIRSLDWFANAKKLIRKELAGEHFDCVYSTYPDKVNHWLAEYVMEKGMADKWIADFRDPMYYEYHDANGQNRKKREQHHIEETADRITIVSEDSLRKFLWPNVTADKITYIPNGYDPDDFVQAEQAAQKEADHLRIFYAGTLYAGKRDFTVLFKALSELSGEGKIDISKVSVEYAGNEWAIMESFAEKYDLAHCCKNYGFITRTQVMEILSQVDCSAVCTHNTQSDKGVVTGKIFELLLMEKPIIAVINGDVPDSELGKIVRECNAGIVYEQPNDEQDYAALKQWLLRAYEEKMRNGFVGSTLDRARREQYSYASIAKKLFGLFCE